jgi:hypothetical protein
MESDSGVEATGWLPDITAVLASIIAVLGTLAGAMASYVFQRRISDHNEAIVREDQPSGVVSS